MSRATHRVDGAAGQSAAARLGGVVGSPLIGLWINQYRRKFAGQESRMVKDFQERLQAVDRHVLAPLVQQALGAPLAEVLNWEQRPLGGGAAQPEEGILGRFHFSGQARVGDELVSWALVLKAFAPPEGSMNDELTAWTYWKRELLTYQSELLADLRADINACLITPRRYALVEYPNEEYWLWMEYIAEETKSWPLEQYRLAARHLGQFNGIYMMGRPLPVYPWLNSGHIRQWLAWGEPGLQDLRRLAQHPRSWITAESAERILRLYSERDRLLAVLEQLPHCLCHHDAHRRNLMARRTANGVDQTVLIDWSATGPGAIGEELATLVGFGLYWLEVPSADAPRFDALAFAGYLAGLHDAGWQGEKAIVRLGYTVSVALLMVMAMNGLSLRLVEDDEVMASWEQMIGHPLSVLQPHWLATTEFLLSLGDEALALITDLRL
jgi:hypothetical protein